MKARLIAARHLPLDARARQSYPALFRALDERRVADVLLPFVVLRQLLRFLVFLKPITRF